MHVMGPQTTGSPEVTPDVGAVVLDNLTTSTNDHECQLQEMARLEPGGFRIEDDEREIFEWGFGGVHVITVR